MNEKLLKEVADLVVSAAVDVINGAREDGESDLRGVRSRMYGIDTEEIVRAAILRHQISEIAKESK